ncbi:MAG: CpaF family protein, partial [Lachnospiraceae bacterium]|nr:CpaF family protein [Lachnospiraceae bacterium]
MIEKREAGAEGRRQELCDYVMQAVDLSHDLTDEELYDLIDESICTRMKDEYISIGEKLRLRKDIFNSIRRLDILQELIDDSDVTEIMVNGMEEIF